MTVRELKQTITLPKDISVETPDSNTIIMKGPKGELKRTFKSHRLNLSQDGKKIILEGKPNNKTTLDLLMTVDSHVKNMVEGLKYGYKYELKIFYSHFPMTAKVEGDIVKITNFTGEKFIRKSKIVGNTKVEIKGEDVTVSGINKEDVGQTAGNLEQRTKVRGKDIRRFQDGIYLTKTGNIDEKKDEEIIKIGNIEEEEVSA
jgi:large subunit ribosomal protein L6